MGTIRFIGACLLLGLASCGSLAGKLPNIDTQLHIQNSPLPVADEQRQPLDDLKMTLDWDPYNLRVDLMGIRGSGQTTQAPMPYSHLIVDFGNGLILDANRNLCLDLSRLYGFHDAKKFRVVKKPPFSAIPYDNGSWEKDGKSFALTLGRGQSDSGTWTDERLEIVPKGQFGVNTETIEKRPDRVFVRGALQLIQSSSDEVDGFNFGAPPMNRIDANTIAISDTFRVTKADDRLQVMDHRFLSGHQGYIFDMTYTFIKTKNGAQFFYPARQETRSTEKVFLGIEVRRIDKLIQVFAGQDLVEEYTIEDLEP